MLIPETEVVIRLEGEELLRRVVQPGEYIIGRSPACDFCVNSTTVSRKHARLTINYSNLFLEDLGSFNGTTVNSGRISGKTQIWHGQRIQLGNVSMQLRKIVANTAAEDASLAPAQAAVVDSLPEDVTFQHSGYQIGALIGRGGMGAVLQAEDEALHRTVAMKVILHGDSPGDVVRFINEARITGQLEHPNIVPVHALGADEHGQPFYTMKLVRGETLKEILNALVAGNEDTIQRHPLGSLLTVFQKVCDGIRFAHSQKVIHRDLKPDNIMIGEYGEVLVMDWGLAKKIGESSRLSPTDLTDGSTLESADAAPDMESNTIAGAILGTPQYMAPEQARGEVDSLDERADIYALGSILYHLLTLQPPVNSGTRDQILQKVRTGEITSPSEAVQRNHSSRSERQSAHNAQARAASDPVDVPGAADPSEETAPQRDAENSGYLPHLPAGRIPQSLEAVVLKALALDPKDRYSTVGELQEDLNAYQHGFATAAEHASNLKLLYLFLKRNRTVSAIAVISLCFAIAFGFQSYRSEQALERLRRAAPTFAEQATARLEAGRIQDALEKIEFAVEVDAENPDYHLLRARMFQSLGRVQEAATAFRKVTQLRKDTQAEENLRLLEDLLRWHGSGSLPPSAKAILLFALQLQGRAKETGELEAELKRTSEETAQTLEQRLGSAAGWHQARMRALGDGTFLLNLSGISMEYLDQLEGLPISKLELANTPLDEVLPKLEQLAKLPIRILNLRSCKLPSIHFLEKFHVLEDLNLADNPFGDLTPVQEHPLRKINLARTPNPDLAPLASCRQLEEIILSDTARNVDYLRPLNSLKKISTKELYGSPAESAVEFWKKIDTSPKALKN